MTLYYRDEDVTVDSVAIAVAGRRYPLARLGLVWHRRVHRWRRGGTMLATRAGAVLAALGLVTAAGFAVAAIDLGEYTWVALSAVALVVTALLALAGFGVDPLLELLDQSHEQGHGVHEIWVRIDGREIPIFTTPDALRFGKVYRALQRAIEQDTPPAAPTDRRPEPPARGRQARRTPA